MSGRNRLICSLLRNLEGYSEYQDEIERKCAGTEHKDGVFATIFAVIDGNENTTENGHWKAERIDAHCHFPEALRDPLEYRLPVNKPANGLLWQETDVVPGKEHLATLTGEVASDHEPAKLQEPMADRVYGRTPKEQKKRMLCRGDMIPGEPSEEVDSLQWSMEAILSGLEGTAADEAKLGPEDVVLYDFSMVGTWTSVQ